MKCSKPIGELMNRFVGKLRLVCLMSMVGAYLALSSLIGCGGSSGGKATISGKVTYKGAPVTDGTITLHPASGAAYPVSMKSDGTFNVSGTPIGEMRVAIDTGSAPVVTKEGYNGTVGSQTPAPAPAHTDIPAKYKDPNTSGLKWEIKAGNNTKDFELTD